MDYKTGEADTSKTYLIVDPTGDLMAEVKLPNTYTQNQVDTQMGQLARALGGQWWSA